MRWVILDTSYLLEIYRVPGFFEQAAHAAIMPRLTAHATSGGRLYVPVPVIFEFANHIADVAAGAVRRELAAKLKTAVDSSLKLNKPWVILPMKQDQLVDELMTALMELCDNFAAEFAHQGIGLTDVAIIDAAKQVRVSAAQYTPRASVHIWTRDSALKAHEPDQEPEPFI